MSQQLAKNSEQEQLAKLNRFGNRASRLHLALTSTSLLIFPLFSERQLFGRL